VSSVSSNRDEHGLKRHLPNERGEEQPSPGRFAPSAPEERLSAGGRLEQSGAEALILLAENRF
jgi:hypothetical protein